MKTKAVVEQIKEVVVLQTQIGEFDLRLRGTSSLIVNRFSSKSLTQIIETEGQKARRKKSARDPEQEYKDSIYLTEDGKPGFPASAFKGAVVEACRFVENVPKTIVRGALHVMGDILPLEGDPPKMRPDIVRVGTFKDKATMRYRAEFSNWAIDLKIRYNRTVLSVEQIVHLFNEAGFGIGVGEWRPEKGKGGSHGTFEVATSPA